ncbi:hypothetical protein [Alteromonas flava]|uniref:hypothetical protein n=1 Tax=Alteromonas flava TaxID=2048003 RepID=UPI000F5EBB31|nr:hypothetical protein [Alteromonas flava]
MSIVSMCLTVPVYAQLSNMDKSVSPLTLQADAIYNDAINPTALGGTEGFGVGLMAAGGLVSTQEAHWWQLDYAVTYEKFKLQQEQIGFSEDPDFYSYNVRIQSRSFVHKAFTVDVVGAHSQQEQKYGEGISRFQDDVLAIDTLTRNRAEVTLVYGSEPSRNAVGAEFFWQDDSYDDANNYSRLFELNQVGAAAELRLWLAGRVGFVSRLSIVEDDYAAFERVDSKLYNALAGIEWEFSGKSALRLLVGGFQRDSDDGQNRSGFSWDLSYDYSPSDYQNLTVTSRRTSAVSEVLSASTSVDVIWGLKWQYAWNDLWSSQASIDWLDKEIESEQLERSITQFDWGLSIGYNISSFQRLMLALKRRDVSSNDASIEYEQNEVRLNWYYEF